jgi:hypothetical protein
VVVGAGVGGGATGTAATGARRSTTTSAGAVTTGADPVATTGGRPFDRAEERPRPSGRRIGWSARARRPFLGWDVPFLPGAVRDLFFSGTALVLETNSVWATGGADPRRGPEATREELVLGPEDGDAAASWPFWINRRGTMSTAPHKMSAAPGRLPFLILVRRTPLSS